MEVSNQPHAPDALLPAETPEVPHYTGLMGFKTDPDSYKTHVSCSCRVSKQGSSTFFNTV